MFDAGVANHDRLADEWRVFDREKFEVDAHGIPRLAEQRRDLVEQAGPHPDKLIFRGLAQSSERKLFFAAQSRQLAITITHRRRAETAGGEREGINTPDRERRR